MTIKYLLIGIVSVLFGIALPLSSFLIPGLILSFLFPGMVGLEGAGLLSLFFLLNFAILPILYCLLIRFITKSWKMSAFALIIIAVINLFIHYKNVIIPRQELKNTIQLQEQEMDDLGLNKPVYLTVLSAEPIYTNHNLSAISIKLRIVSKGEGDFIIIGTPEHSRQDYSTVPVQLLVDQPIDIEMLLAAKGLEQDEILYLNASKENLQSAKKEVFKQNSWSVPIIVTASNPTDIISKPADASHNSYYYKIPNFPLSN